MSWTREVKQLRGIIERLKRDLESARNERQKFLDKAASLAEKLIKAREALTAITDGNWDNSDQAFVAIRRIARAALTGKE